MYRIREIQAALLQLVGWEQGYSEDNMINKDLTTSESGLSFQGAHPLMTLENIRATMPEDFPQRYAEWDENKRYRAGNIVGYQGKYYKALLNHTGIVPGTDASYWERYYILSDYLKKLVAYGIAEMVQTFTQIKKLERETKPLLEHRTFFDGAGRVKATLMNNHKLVGFEIVPVRSMGVTAKIEKVGLQMYGGTGTIKLYLFHSSQVDPIKTFEVEFTKTNGGFQWFTLDDCYLPYISNDNNSGGSWFLCYNQDELPQGMEAVNVSKDWSREPCGTCNIGSVETWRELTKYLQVSPFMVNAWETFTEYPQMWDIAQTMYTNTQNYGMNCEISVGCDLTDFIITQRQIFATVLQKQVTAIALRTMAMNPSVRVNRNQSNVNRLDVLYELDGSAQGTPRGLGYELKKAYEALRFDTQGLDRVCLSCNNHGVKYSHV